MDDKAKIITQIDIRSINFRDQEIEEYFNCILCGGELSYHHNTDFVDQVVEEQAECPSCRVQHKKNFHALQ